MMRSSAGRLLFTAAAFTLFVNDGAYYGRAVVAGRALCAAGCWARRARATSVEIRTENSVLRKVVVNYDAAADQCPRSLGCAWLVGLSVWCPYPLGDCVSKYKCAAARLLRSG